MSWTIEDKESDTLLVAGTFEYAWHKAKQVKGWLAYSEAKCLWEAAQRTPEDGLIVEVGSYRGRSTTLLCETYRHVTAIDPLEDEEDAKAFATAIEGYEKVLWWPLRSIQVDTRDIRFPAVIDMIYIDADHAAPNPLNDFNHFRPNLRKGSIVAFHDYSSEPGVTEAVEQLEEDGTLRWRELVGSMWIGEYRG